MPHLSDGQLHAYLDGALDHLPEARAEEVREHLRSCDTCRSRLDEERRLLERSSAILEAGGPGEVEAPPLEELRERARIREERAAREGGGRWTPMPRGHRSPGARGRALAWAATVVLALGLGWVTRDLQDVRSPMARPSLESVESVESGESVESPADAAPAGEGPGRPGAGDQEAAPTPTGDVGADPPMDRPVDRPVDRPPPPEDAAARPQADLRSREPTAPSPGATVVGRVVDEASLEPLRGAAVVLEDSAGVRHEGVLTQPDGRFVLRAERPGSYRAVVEAIGYGRTRTDFFELSPDETVAREIRAPARALGLDALTVEGVPAEEAEAIEGAARLAPQPVADAADVTPAAERNARARAGAGLGMAMAPELASSHVPGLPVVRIDPQADPVGFVIVQRLASGDTLRLRWIAGSALDDDDAAASSFLEPLSEGWSEVLLRRGDGWLVARAPLPESELRALLSRPR